MRIPSFPAFAALLTVQSTTFPDTIVARMVAERSVLDWTNGILAFTVLVLGIATLVTLILLMVQVRRSMIRTNILVEQFVADSGPVIKAVSAVAVDAREVVAMLRTDVERVTDAAGIISEQLIDIADTAAQRVDEINAVLDVLQDEIEHSAIGTVAAVRGVRVGTRELTKVLRPNRDVETDRE